MARRSHRFRERAQRAVDVGLGVARAQQECERGASGGAHERRANAAPLQPRLDCARRSDVECLDRKRPALRTQTESTGARSELPHAAPEARPERIARGRVDLERASRRRHVRCGRWAAVHARAAPFAKPRDNGFGARYERQRRPERLRHRRDDNQPRPGLWRKLQLSRRPAAARSVRRCASGARGWPPEDAQRLCVVNNDPRLWRGIGVGRQRRELPAGRAPAIRNHERRPAARGSGRAAQRVRVVVRKPAHAGASPRSVLHAPPADGVQPSVRKDRRARGHERIAEVVEQVQRRAPEARVGQADERGQASGDTAIYVSLSQGCGRTGRERRPGLERIVGMREAEVQGRRKISGAPHSRRPARGWSHERVGTGPVAPSPCAPPEACAACRRCISAEGWATSSPASRAVTMLPERSTPVTAR